MPEITPQRRNGGLLRVEQVMGMPISLELADPLSEPTLEHLADETFRWFREVDQRFSTYIEDSEVNRLDRGELRSGQLSTDLREVLDACAELWRVTDGFFDVYATGRLDPSGYVKGWSVQIASDRLVAAGATNHVINAGGDIAARGGPRPDEDWRIGVIHPFQTQQVCWVLGIRDQAVATSGTYERGLHVINPHRGEPARDLRSVTVVGPDLALADAYATTALAMGRPGLEWLAALDGYPSAVVTQDGEAYRSENLPVVPAEDQSSATPTGTSQS